MRSPVKWLSVLCAALLFGCHTYHPATVTVETSSGAPVKGAQVTAYPMYLFNPTSNSILFTGSSEILEPFTATGDSNVTDEDGTTTIQIVEGNPLQLRVAAPSHQAWEGIIEITTQKTVYLKTTVPSPTLIVTAE